MNIITHTLSPVSYAIAGLQAVLELYFVRFLYVCLGVERATSLSTACVNICISINLLAGISAGILADKIIGSYIIMT